MTSLLRHIEQTGSDDVDTSNPEKIPSFDSLDPISSIEYVFIFQSSSLINLK